MSTLVHAMVPLFSSKIRAMTEPRLAVAYHFQNHPDTIADVVAVMNSQPSATQRQQPTGEGRNEFTRAIDGRPCR